MSVAKTALWIAELQMMEVTQEISQVWLQPFPLKANDNIVEGNALRMDWNDVLPVEECDYVIGNPPFLGYSNLDESQKEDRRLIFGRVQTVDYVACWYHLAVDYMKNTAVRAAFVSTNSVCQGQQVEPIWKPLFDRGMHIDFAWTTFVWNNEAADQAHVHVVIVGFSYVGEGPRRLFAADGASRECENINGYLAAAVDVFVTKRNKPICNVPEMSQGFKPADHGCLLMRQDELDEMLVNDPSTVEFVRPFSMGADFINGDNRYCLWLQDVAESEIDIHPKIRRRVEECRIWRSQQTKTGDAYKLKNTPQLLRPCNKFHDRTYIGFPKVTSGRRRYIPLGFVTNGMIPGDMLYFVETDSLYHFGVAMSQFQNAWMRIVAGRLKSDYRYSNTLVWNNFVWPDAEEKQQKAIAKTAQGILDARANHPGATLADLYDPERMPADLCAAHEANDAAVESAYGVNFNGDEEKIVAHLFKLYSQLTGE